MRRALLRVLMATALAVALALSSSISAQPDDLPEGLAFAGLKHGVWQIYRVQDGTLAPISDIEHPRTFSTHTPSGRTAYVGADGMLRMDAAHEEAARVSLSLDPEGRYTQPSFSADGQWLLAVELPGGKSRRTNIVGFDMRTGTRYGYVRKRTAQFEPHMGSARYLHYATAICVDDCGGMIWELWRRDMQTGKQVQLTLLNAISNQPHARGDQIYFSSNADGGRFHIWRMIDEVGAIPHQLTRGQVRDSDPTTDAQGALYFLRQAEGGTQIMTLNEGLAVPLSVSAQFDDIRNLEISP